MSVIVEAKAFRSTKKASSHVLHSITPPLTMRPELLDTKRQTQPNHILS